MSGDTPREWCRLGDQRSLRSAGWGPVISAFFALALGCGSGVSAQPLGGWLVKMLLPMVASELAAVEVALPSTDLSSTDLPGNESPGEGEFPAAPTIWVELTLLDDDLPPIAYVLRPRADRLLPVLGVDRGAIMACAGTAGLGVTCREQYLEPGTPVRLEIEPGQPVTGRYVLDLEAVAGARVAVVPDGLESSRPFVMPLGPKASAAAVTSSRDLSSGGRSSRSLVREALVREALVREALVREALTDDDGRFQLPALAAGDYRLEALLPSGRVHHSDPFVVPAPQPGSLEALDIGTIAVRGGLSLDVVVVDDRGQPVASAVVAARQGDRPASARFFESASDAEGRARLGGFFVEDPVVVRCTAKGHADAELTFDLVPVETGCVVARLAQASGRVVGPAGTPPPGAGAALWQLASAARGGGAEATSRDENEVGVPGGTEVTVVGDALRSTAATGDGSFKLAGLEPGDYRLRASAPGFAVVELDFSLAGGERLALGDLALGAAAAFDGVVVDARSGEPIEAAVVSLVSPAAAETAITDDEGGFSLTEPETETPVEIVVTHPAYARARRVIARDLLEVGEPLRVELERGGRILVVIWDAQTGRSCRGCVATLRPGGIELVTGSDGEALSELLEPGRYRVELSRFHNLGSTVIEAPEAEVRFARVYEDGIAPVWFGQRRQAVRVRFRPQPDASWMLVARSPRRSQRILAGTDGAFEVEQEADEALGLYLLGWDPSAEATVEVRQALLPPADEAREVVFDLPSGEVRGRITSGSIPVDGARVRLRGLHDRQRTALLETDADGRFRIPHVPPGIYGLEIGERPLSFVRVGVGEHVDVRDWELVPGTFGSR